MPEANSPPVRFSVLNQAVGSDFSVAARRKSRPPTVLAADRYRTVLEEGALQLAPEPMQQAVTARLGRIAFELGCERLKERGAL
jgi:hypothetical protein